MGSFKHCFKPILIKQLDLENFNSVFLELIEAVKSLFQVCSIDYIKFSISAIITGTKAIVLWGEQGKNR